MKAIRAFLLRKSLLVRIILSYLFVGLLVIGVLTLVITSKVSRNLKEELTLSTDRALEQSYNTADIMLNSAYLQFASAYSSADIQAGLYANAFDTELMGRIGTKLTDLANANPMVHSVYLVNKRHELVFSSLTTARSFDDFYDRQILQLMENGLSVDGSIFIPRNTSFVYDTKPFEGNLITVAYTSTRGERFMNGGLILNVDQQILQNMMMNGVGSKSFQSMILNRQGLVISHSDHQMISKNLSDVEAVSRILETPARRGVLETEVDGKPHRMFYIKSDSLGWIFIGNVNYENLLSQVNAIKRFILTVTAVLLIVVAISGAFFTRIIYGPIQKLVTNIGKTPEHATVSDAASEFDLLSAAFRYMERRVHDLQTSVAGYQNTEKREVLQRLTTGGWTGEAEMGRKLAQAGIDPASPGYQVCMLRLDSFTELSEAYSTRDLMLLKYAITNIAEEIGAAYFPTHAFDGGEDRIVILFLKPEGMVPELTHLVRDMQENTKRYLRLSVSAAIGSCAFSLHDVPKSWQSAYNASRYRLVFGWQSLTFGDIEDSREPVPDAVSSSMEKQVADGMRLGDTDKAVHALKEYVTRIRRASFDEMLLLLNQLLFTITRTSKSMASGEVSGLGTDIGALGQQLFKWETLAQMEEWFAGLIEAAVSLRDKQSTQKNAMIVEKLKQHIHEHYTDSNLTVEALSELAGLSVNYLRKVFKDIAGISLNLYISEYRFEKAKALLLTTDLPANRIGEMVGFDNTKYFYISFKKYSGKTPDHFRKSGGDFGE
ncbi:Helix-turn-helix domain-containing protein [Paenibacillus sp. UNCCL117]|uniref:helix-turn-helix domain-containing protein n=1 Tax=unclassified Paenibacillus TaxID=185978 RepID=UPI00088B4A5D|nr:MULTISPECIES: helix-turn-helix domain-containing protein [unclassified Paenibacillus]SDD06949.1 Helix-turn-helix domain-containing protein [Paenibacillus sp. cl123]SFW31587.1 Helix-turn-helix domain-containing protein [Paenibacillus sp. UNCCL117]